MELRTVPIGCVRIPANRGRREFRDIAGLAESLKTKGFIHPITCRVGEEPGTYELIAGERRYRAAILASLAEIPIVVLDNVSDLDAKQLELEENIERANMSWQEQASLHHQIDALRRKKDASWTQKQTAELVSVSEATISRQIKIAEKLNKMPELVDKIIHLPMNAAIKVIEQHELTKADKAQQHSKFLDTTANLQLGNCLDLIESVPSNSVDLWICDPPTINVPQTLSLLRELSPSICRVLRPGSHWYCFVPLNHVEQYLNALAPLEVFLPILIWDSGRSSDNGTGYNYLSRGHGIIFGHKPPRGRKLKRAMHNVISSPAVPAKLRMHDDEKPHALIRTLLEQSTQDGNTVLDTFAGSGVTLKVARSLNCRSIGFEIDPGVWTRAQLKLNESLLGD